MVFNLRTSSFFAAMALVYLGLCVPNLPAEPSAKGASAELEARWKSQFAPILENYCYDCHGEGIDKGELDFDDFDSLEAMIADRERWKRIRGHIDQQLMPPLDEDQPSRADRDTMVKWIDDAIFPVDPKNPDPGRVTLRRLNRIEYVLQQGHP